MTTTAQCAVPVTPIEVTGDTRWEKVKSIVDKLETGVQEIFTSGKFQEYLSFLAKFHDYSFGNVILIAMQKPDASLVAGYGDWLKKHHRYVKKHEKGIKILAPIISKKRKDKDAETDAKDGQQTDDKDENQKVVCAFKIVTVFDVSQTDGEPLPSLGVEELTGTVDRFNGFMAALESVSPVPIAYEQIDSGAHGYFSPRENRIAIQDGMSQLQTAKTTVHEVAHAVLHAWPNGEKPKDGPDRHSKEVQAESVAYVVCQHYGLDTSDYSFGYVAGWSTGQEVKELKASLDVIRKTSHELISAIDAYMDKEVSA